MRLMLCAVSALALLGCGERSDPVAVDDGAVVADGGVVAGDNPDAETLGSPETPATLGAENNAIPSPLPASTFVRWATLSNTVEIDTSKLALEKSDDAAVRAFAQRMIDEHGRTGQRLQQVASLAGAAVVASETDPAGVDPLGSATVLARLRQADRGAAFDREYKLAQVQAHEWTIELFEEAESADAMPAQLKTFAEQTLPALRQHLEMARDLPGDLPGAVVAPVVR